MKQIEEFGQAPAQLFQSPHPPRLSLERAEVVRPLASPVPGANTAPANVSEAQPPRATMANAALGEANSERPAPPEASARSLHGVVSYPRERVSHGAVLVVSDLLPWAERLVTVDAHRTIGYHGWYAYSPETSPPFRLRPDTSSIDASIRRDGSDRGGSGTGSGNGSTQRMRRLSVPFAPGGLASCRLLEPPPGNSTDCGDDDGGDNGARGGSGGSTSFFHGLGGSHASVASMASLLSLPPFGQGPAGQMQGQWSQNAQHFSPSGGAPDVWGVQNEDSAAVMTSGALALSYDQEGSDDGWDRRGYESNPTTASGLGIGSHLFAVHAKTRLLFSGGHWDSSFRVTAVDTGRLVVSVARHRDVVTSLSLADGGAGCRRLVTASRDTTIMVWDVDPWNEIPVSASSLVHVLYGHDTPVTCVCASASLDAVVSSGEDGTVVVHTLWGGEYVRTITPRSTPRSACGGSTTTCDAKPGRDDGHDVDFEVSGGDSKVKEDCHKSKSASMGTEQSRLPPPWPPVHWVGLSTAGYVVTYSTADSTLRSYTVNGRALGVASISDNSKGPLRAFVFSEDGSVLLCGGDDRVVTLRWVHNLALANDGAREDCGEAVLTGAAPPLAGVAGASTGVGRFGSAVRCLALTAGERHLLVGLSDGTLGVLALDANYLRQRLRTKLDQLGF